ncbi:MAG: hypothetical protein ACREXX_03085 [Gammaproteobacteria bacterium]
MLASRQHGTRYVGVTSELAKRVWQHKNDVLPGFTRYGRFHATCGHQRQKPFP